MRQCFRSFLVGLITAGAPAAAAAQEAVTLPGRNVTLSAVLMKPAGAGPFPAVVALHGCGGQRDARGEMIGRDAAWGRVLVGQGFVVLMPDSYGSRGLGPQCDNRERSVRPGAGRAADAAAAAVWLGAQPFVKKEAISLIGWSNGGSTVLWALRRGAPGYARAVAFYPGCRTLLERGGWKPTIPTLLLIGEADDWTPAAPCRELAAAAGGVVTFVAYPGAFHAFDNPAGEPRKRRGVAFSADGSGEVTVGRDPAARADAIARVGAFLAR